MPDDDSLDLERESRVYQHPVPPEFDPRPRGGPITLYLPADVLAWLHKQPNMSAAIAALVRGKNEKP